VFDPTLLAHLVSDMGADHVLLGTDHPFELGDTHPVETVRALGLGADETETILWRTAAALLDVPVATQSRLDSVRPGQ
jgi:aminocarboxymuconate-semialdehyde decarboxylase